MAYIDQDRKRKIAANVKRILKTFAVKGSLSVMNHSTLVLKIKSSPLDFIGNAIEVIKANPRYHERLEEFNKPGFKPTTEIVVNPYWYHEHFSGDCLKFLHQIVEAMNEGNHNNSDIQSDYFDVGWYIDIRIGKWNSPYILEKHK